MKSWSEQREQPPPAGGEREQGEHADDRLVHPRRPAVDDVEVAVRIGAERGHDASSTMPAATVSLLCSSIRMNAPVARLRA